MTDFPDLERVREEIAQRPPAPNPPSMRRHGQRGREPADPLLVDLVRDIAGDGTVDERCARILAAFGPSWGFDQGDDDD